MAAAKQDPLQILDQMFNEILIQTGKHLKANLKDGSKGIGGASNAMRAQTSSSLSAYHYALDDLESEITRAKAVFLRDLEKLRAARAPPAPAPAPAPAPIPQPVAPPAPMMELPSSAAHTVSAPAFARRPESKPAAPFPDMGTGMGMGMGMGAGGGASDVVDLTGGDKKTSPRAPASAAARPPARPPAPPAKSEVKPSPKPAPKPAPKPSQPAKVTPVPPPQIPRLQPPPPPPPAAQPSKFAQNALPAPPPQDPGPKTAPGGLPPSAGPLGAAAADALGFTDMQFSLAPPSGEAAGAPPAPMSEFGAATFAPSGRGKEAALGNRGSGPAASGGQSAPAAAPPQPQPPKDQAKPHSNSIDDLFILDGGGGAADNIFDLGGGGVNDSTFDDMMFFGSNDSDMAPFDEQYF
ncbi:hypothetical protein GGS23DRAFT_608516 [Durotheca rogersii]|uniref:uncharacterized protein n=1 Tax=Durotheca rogersii TaxID=419775 RepID=UPI0022208030|nr:uncharacterized protein GGS23DRAFT_608516 [Durotheca rogersii]KAI5867945.1 hypothetical protein GGS23DRAFT_608516 [Durotheca rogersii]